MVLSPARRTRPPLWILPPKGSDNGDDEILGHSIDKVLPYLYDNHAMTSPFDSSVAVRGWPIHGERSKPFGGD
jgi:hypothetical protein